MALAKTGLMVAPVQVTAGNTTTIYTAANSKKAYIRTILIYHNQENSGSSLSQIAHIYVVPNGATRSEAHAIGRITLPPDDTIFFEMQYPITLTTNGDTIQVYNVGSGTGGTGSSSKLNCLVLGDVEQ